MEFACFGSLLAKKKKKKKERKLTLMFIFRFDALLLMYEVDISWNFVASRDVRLMFIYLVMQKQESVLTLVFVTSAIVSFI